MSQPAKSSPASVSARSAAIAVLGGSALGGVVGWLLAPLLGGVAGAAPSAGVWGGVVWLLAGAFGLLAMLLMSQGQADRLGMAVLASSTVRMLAALFLGLLVYFAISPDGRVFWITFLCSGVGALVGETLWAVMSINAVRTPAPSAAPHSGAL